MQFLSFTGIVKEIQSLDTSMQCMQVFTIESFQGDIINFLISRDTYFIQQAVIQKGDKITGYYDAHAPVPLIYPPQYKALVIEKETDQYFVKVAYFNEHLVSEDGQLQLNLSRDTRIYYENGQQFEGDIRNRNLIVIYGPTSRSIPAQTTPYQLIVVCR